MSSKLGNELKKLRGKMTLREAAEKTGISHTYLNNLERGIDPRNGKEIYPSPSVLKSLSEAYKVPYLQLLTLAGYIDSDVDETLQSVFINLLDNGKTRDTLESHAVRSDITPDANDEFIDKIVTEMKDVFPLGRIRKIPIVAEIPCGAPILTEDNIIGSYPVDTAVKNLNGGEYVWVRAKGDSMINANIVDGALVLIRLQPEAENGEIAAVCVDLESATLKRVFFGDGTVTLAPENPSMKSVTYSAERIRIVGVKHGIFIP